MKTQQHFQLIYRKHFFLLLFFFVLCLLPPSYAYAEPTPIRVGFFELPGFNEYDASGNPSGYNIDYLTALAEHTGWTYEFVKVKSWPEAYQMLLDQKIDLLSPSRKTPEREAQFAFSHLPFGEEYGSILTLDTNYDLAYEDFVHFSKLKFGCVDTLVMKEDFFNYAKANGFTPNITYYKDTNALLSALNVGEVDAVVANLMIAKSNMKVLGKFSPDSFYYMVHPSNSALLRELDTTISHMKTIHSTFESDLTEKYFRFYTSTAFTKAEMEFIENAPALRIGYLDDRRPISYIDEESMQPAGITRDILDRIATISGLQFTYVPLPQGSIDLNYLSQHKIDLVSSVERNNLNTAVNTMRLSHPYLISQKVAVGKSSQTTLLNMENARIAVATGSQTLLDVIHNRYPNAQILHYTTLKECFDAVLSGTADILIQNKYAVERFLLKPKYKTLLVLPNESIPDELSLATLITPDTETEQLNRLSDPRLIGIINKSIDALHEYELSDIIISHTLNDPYQFDLSDFYDEYKYFIFSLTLALLALVGILYYSFWLKSNSLRLLAANETKLKNITNNINGGVLVLLPDKGFEILFANEGFLSLIQYTKDEFEAADNNHYITYVHPDDIPTLNQVIAYHSSDEYLSIRLRLMRKDGTYLPTLFNGTLSQSNSSTKELYCVIMDLSEQLSIMDKLEFEKARYQFLIEKSNEIIFDIDWESKVIFLAPNFKKEFGWTLPNQVIDFTLDLILPIWHIHEDDIALFQEALTLLLLKQQDCECNVRIRKNDLTYHWYCISHNIMKNEENPLRIIGKVVNIDAEMKEKERLLRQTEIDALTGLYNKDAFLKFSKTYFMETTQGNSALIFLDLDNFKQVNDVLGHITGDMVIQEAAKKLQLIFSQYDIIGRFGGDEFCILVKEIPTQTLCDKMAWAVEKMRATYQDDENEVSISISAGIAFSSISGRCFTDLLSYADQALYQAKDKGKNQFMIYRSEP